MHGLKPLKQFISTFIVLAVLLAYKYKNKPKCPHD